MACMGPKKDDYTASILTEKLKNSDFPLRWGFIGTISNFERISQETVKESFMKRHYTEEIDYHLARQLAVLSYGLLYGKTREKINWRKFETKIDETLWAFDAHDW